MKNVNEDEVIKALLTIKNYCRDNKTCEECILIGLCDGGTMTYPPEWEVEEEE